MGGFCCSSGDGLLGVELGEFVGELMVAFCFLCVVLESGCLSGWHALADIATVLPNLVFKVGAESYGAVSIGRGALAIFFDEGAGLHGCDGGDLI